MFLYKKIIPPTPEYKILLHMYNPRQKTLSYNHSYLAYFMSEPLFQLFAENIIFLV